MNITPLYKHLIKDMKNCAALMDEAIERKDFHAAGNWKVLHDYIRELANKEGSGFFIESTESAQPKAEAVNKS